MIYTKCNEIILYYIITQDINGDFFDCLIKAQYVNIVIVELI